MYIYRSCCGNLFTADEEIEDAYCKVCGDWDDLLGYAETKEQAILILEDEYYCKEYIEEFINENWIEE